MVDSIGMSLAVYTWIYLPQYLFLHLQLAIKVKCLTRLKVHFNNYSEQDLIPPSPIEFFNLSPNPGIKFLCVLFDPALNIIAHINSTVCRRKSQNRCMLFLLQKNLKTDKAR